MKFIVNRLRQRENEVIEKKVIGNWEALARVSHLLENRYSHVLPLYSSLHKKFKIGTRQECYIVAKEIDAREKLR